MNCGNKSEGDKLVNKKANTNKNRTNLEYGRFWIRNHIPTPTKAIIYVGDSEPELKITVNSNTEERNSSLNF